MGKKINQIENRNLYRKLRDEALGKGATEDHTKVSYVTKRKKDEEKLDQIMENLRKGVSGVIQIVSSTVEAMTSRRSYRPALGVDAALEEIAKNRDTFYDPEVVDACLRLFKEKGFKLE